MARAATIRGTVDAVVVGAGFGGLYMLHRLRELGLSVQVFEAGGDVGGTWYWNRYPGARCDVPSLYYSYTWSQELQREWRWTEKYATQPEILHYARHVAERFDLLPHIAFDTRVTSAVFDEDAGVWAVETDRGDRVIARFCIMATGCLSVPRAPHIDGDESFGGPRYHTGRWPHEGVDFTGLRVGVIGTGSSGIQVIPQIAKQASRVTVFQRTPNFSIPARNSPLTDKDIADFWAAYPAYIEGLKNPPFARGTANAAIPSEEDQRRRYEELWNAGGAGFVAAYPTLLINPQVNDVAATFVREKIAAIVKDPKVAAALQPHDHPLGTKRICVDIDYYATFNRSNVELVDLRAAPIEAITPAGVVTGQKTYELDAIVYATGFDAMTGALLAIDIRGQNGEVLRKTWAHGPRTYLGLAVAGFPNLFVITGPGSPSVLSNMIASCEQHVDWITDCIAFMAGQGLRRIEAEPAAQNEWVDHVNATAEMTLFPRANSWYVGANIPGKPRVFMPYVGLGYRRKCDRVAARGYEGFRLN